MTRYVCMAAAAVVLTAGVFGGCSWGEAQPTTPSSATPPSTSQAPPVRVDSACDVLTPQQVEEVLGSETVTETDAGTGSSDFGGCFFQSDGRYVLDVSVARGMIGDGQQAADSAATDLASGDVERIDGVGQGAAYFPADGPDSGVTIAFDAGGSELVLVTLQGELARDQLIDLARTVDDNV